ncbi:MAG: hypothetical protein ACLQHS_19390 [Candidatus Limnocylindrales bacterium]
MTKSHAVIWSPAGLSAEQSGILLTLLEVGAVPGCQQHYVKDGQPELPVRATAFITMQRREDPAAYHRQMASVSRSLQRLWDRRLLVRWTGLLRRGVRYSLSEEGYRAALDLAEAL